MGYTFENYSIDMKKVKIFSETAYAEYEFAIEEAVLDGADSYDISDVVTESARDLLNKIKAVFKKIIESIKKFFVNLFEKIKSIFTKKKEDVVEQAIAEHPEILKEKVQVPDLNEINSYCGKRFMLRRKLVKEFKAGSLTRDKFDQIVAQHQSLGQRLRNCKAVTVTLSIFKKFKDFISRLFSKNKKKRDDLVKEVETIENATEDQVEEKASDTATTAAMGADVEPTPAADTVSGPEVARTVTQGELEDTQVETKAVNDTVNIVISAANSNGGDSTPDTVSISLNGASAAAFMNSFGTDDNADDLDLESDDTL